MDYIIEARRVVINGLTLSARLGIYEHEKTVLQPIQIDLEMDVNTDPILDEIKSVVSYDFIIEKIKNLLEQGHINLAETLAEKIADICLKDPRVQKTQVRVQKLSAVPEAKGVGSEVIKARTQSKNS